MRKQSFLERYQEKDVNVNLIVHYNGNCINYMDII